MWGIKKIAKYDKIWQNTVTLKAIRIKKNTQIKKHAYVHLHLLKQDWK